MSIDKSLARRRGLQGQRNVLSRWERVLKLRELEKWEDGRSVYGLPKVRVEVVKARKHEKPKEEKAAAEGAEAPAAEGAEAPAKEGSAPAKGAAPAKEAAKGKSAEAGKAAARPAAKGGKA